MSVRVRRVRASDPLVRPLLRELSAEYTERYGSTGGAVHEELLRYPDAEFEPPYGSFLLLTDGATAVAGGAIRRYDAVTAEVKRVWTHSRRRRQGLARRVMAALEAEARRLGYARMYLTTGPRQPEARGLYLATGYTPLFDVARDPLEIGPLPFAKTLAVRATPRSAARRAAPARPR